MKKSAVDTDVVCGFLFVYGYVALGVLMVTIGQLPLWLLR
jgi:hypothetical protein